MKKLYTVSYDGNNTRYKNFSETLLAQSKREAVEAVYDNFLGENYFPDEDGNIFDCDGHQIADQDDDCIEYDGGYFTAEEEQDTIEGYAMKYIEENNNGRDVNMNPEDIYRTNNAI